LVKYLLFVYVVLSSQNALLASPSAPFAVSINIDTGLSVHALETSEKERICQSYGEIITAGRGPSGVGVASSFECGFNKNETSIPAVWTLNISISDTEIAYTLADVSGENPKAISQMSLPIREGWLKLIMQADVAGKVVYSLLYDAPVSVWLADFAFYKSYDAVTQPDYVEKYHMDHFPHGEVYEMLVPNEDLNQKSSEKALLLYDPQKTAENNGQNVWRLNERSKAILNQNRNLWAKRNSGVGATFDDVVAQTRQFYADVKEDEKFVVLEILEFNRSILELNYGVSIVNSPELFKKAKHIKFSADFRGFDVFKIRFDFDTVPEIVNEDEKLKWTRYHLGYIWDYDLRKWPILFTRLEIVPMIGSWTMDGEFYTGGLLNETEAFKLQNNIAVGAQFGLDVIKNWGHLRLWSALGTAKVDETKKGITSPDKINARAFHIINGASFGYPLNDWSDLASFTLLAFIRNESLNLGNSEDSDINGISMSITFAGLGLAAHF